MTVANLIAGRQDSVKRMLAYSSIAHAGYALVGVVAIPAGREASASVLFYLSPTRFDRGRVRRADPVRSPRRRSRQLRRPRRHRQAPSRGGARVLAVSAFARGRAADRRLLRQAYVFKAAIGAELYVLAIIGASEQRDRRVLLPARDRLHDMREPAPGAPIATPMRSGYVVAALVIAPVSCCARPRCRAPRSNIAVASTALTPIDEPGFYARLTGACLAWAALLAALAATGCPRRSKKPSSPSLRLRLRRGFRPPLASGPHLPPPGGQQPRQSEG